VIGTFGIQGVKSRNIKTNVHIVLGGQMENLLKRMDNFIKMPHRQRPAYGTSGVEILYVIIAVGDDTFHLSVQNRALIAESDIG